jgi:hypothetical protein
LLFACFTPGLEGGLIIAAALMLNVILFGRPEAEKILSKENALTVAFVAAIFSLVPIFLLNVVALTLAAGAGLYLVFLALSGHRISSGGGK